MTRRAVQVPVQGSPSIAAAYSGPITEAVVDLLTLREDIGDPADVDQRTGGIWSNTTTMTVRQCLTVSPGVTVGTLGARGQRWDWHEAQVEFNGIAASVTVPIWTPPCLAYAYQLAIQSDSATSGSVVGTRYQFQVYNATQSLNLLSTAFGTDGTGVNGGEIGAKVTKVITFDQNTSLNLNDYLELVITRTGAPAGLTSARVKFTLRGYPRGQ